MSVDVPVALILFRRPKKTKMVFEAIRQAEPKKLFVIADGPRSDRPGEAEQCEATRAVVDDVDWDCEVFKNFSDTNLGCGPRVSSGIDWVFDHVDRAIILEDDCLPHASFFPFCESVLERYADTPQVMHVNGNTYGLDQRGWHNYSYSFADYPQVWGWATWRRAWEAYDWEMSDWPAFRDAGLLDSLDGGAAFAEPRRRKWEQVYDERYRNTWDYQWHFAVMRYNGLAVVPERNLVTNIGFDEMATHTVNLDSEKANIHRHSIDLPLKHPPFRVSDERVNRVYRENMLRPSLKTRIENKVKRITRRLTG
jgi:hypothetical protein